MLFKEKDTNIKALLESLYSDCVIYQGVTVPRIVRDYFRKYRHYNYTLDQVYDVVSDVFVKLFEMENKGMLKNRIEHVQINIQGLTAAESEMLRLQHYLHGYIKRVLQNKPISMEVPSSAQVNEDTQDMYNKAYMNKSSDDADIPDMIEDENSTVTDVEIVSMLKFVDAADHVKKQHGYSLMNLVLKAESLEQILKKKMRTDSEYFDAYKMQYTQQSKQPLNLGMIPISIDWHNVTDAEFRHRAKKLGVVGNRSLMSLLERLIKLVKLDPDRVYSLAVEHHLVEAV